MEYDPKDVEKAMKELTRKRALAKTATAALMAKFANDEEKTAYFKNLSDKAVAKKKLQKLSLS